MKKLITTCAFLMLVSGIFAQEFTEEGIVYNITPDNTVAVTSYTPIFPNPTNIPSTVFIRKKLIKLLR